MTETADVVVIGAGIVGCTTAYVLAERGVDVVVVEQGDVGGAVSGASLACVGIHMIDRQELELLKLSCQMWRDMEARLDTSIEYQRCGQLRFIAREEELGVARSWLEVERAYGLDVELLEPPAVRDIAPALEGDIAAATWSVNDATVNPFLSCRALITVAQRRGARLITQRQVTGIELRNGQVEAVQTSTDRIYAPWVVNASGPWAKRIAAMAGVNVPVVPRKAQCLATEHLAPVIPCVVGACESAGGVEVGYTQIQQAQSGQVLFNTVLGGGERADGQQDMELDVDYQFVMDSIRTLLWLFPSLGEVNLLRSWARYEAVTPDDRFIVGPVPRVEGFLMAAGDCGVGFVRAPMIGRLLSDVIVDGAPSYSLDLYRLERFAETSVVCG